MGTAYIVLAVAFIAIELDKKFTEYYSVADSETDALQPSGLSLSFTDVEPYNHWQGFELFPRIKAQLFKPRVYIYSFFLTEFNRGRVSQLMYGVLVYN